MSLKFRHKVFLTLLLYSVVIVVCMLLIARYYAFRDFENYVRKVEMGRLQELAAVLGQEYQKSGSWTPLAEDLGHWLEWQGRGPGPPPPGEIGGRPPPPLPLLLAPGMAGGGRKPPHFGEPPPPPGPPPGPQAFPPPGPPPGPPPPHGHPSRFVLFDAAKQPLTGNEPYRADDYNLKAILVDGQVVGWLGLRQHQRPQHPLDVEFLRNQSRTFYSLGSVALLLAVLVTFVLSRHLLAPVRELAAATRALTSRRFDTRLKIRAPDEFGQLAADFNIMAAALERYELMRRQWLADISHELRTPLAVLRGEIEAMQDGVREFTPRALESLHFEVMHVGRIVQDLYDLSLIESRAFDADLTAVNPLEVLDETLRSFQTRFGQWGIRIESNGTAGPPVAIKADSGRLRQLFSNLLENTLRYAQAPGVLKISHALTPGQFTLLFEDSGPGVPEEALERLFDRLYRVDKARSRAQGGSGLGLAICKGLMECFGGRITASHAFTGGLRISMVFPVLSSPLVHFEEKMPAETEEAAVAAVSDNQGAPENTPGNGETPCTVGKSWSPKMKLRLPKS
ncbi:MAG: ATP-binding protein [Desulfobaccales bacterium]